MKTKIEQTNAPGWTPGPWRVHREGSKVGILTHDNVEHVATVCALFRQEQNARLIAAAPEMAEALWEVTRCLSEYRQTGYMHGWDKPLAEARALLARIGGAS